MAFPGERILQKAKERPVRKGVGGEKLDDGAGELCSANAKLQRNKESVMASPALLDRGSRLTKIIRILVAGCSALMYRLPNSRSSGSRQKILNGKIASF